MSVDFSHPFLRHSLRAFCEKHRQRLDGIRSRLAGWASESARVEEERAQARGLPRRELAAVLDVDEVIRSNIHMHSYPGPMGDREGPCHIDFHAADHFLAPDGKPWPRDDLRLNPLLPGARELLEELRRLEIHVYLVTGRRESLRSETIENFVFVGLAAEQGAVFCPDDLSRAGADATLSMCPDAECPPPGRSIRPFKEARRREIEKRHRIMLNIGDQVSDLGYYGDKHVLLDHPFYYTA